MPQVGGDPIVESGSNADGEWTRWSDGTQVTLRRVTNVQITAIGGAGSIFYATPRVFDSSYKVSGSWNPSVVLDTASERTAFSSTEASCGAGVDSWEGRGNSAWSVPLDLTFFAIGRWK